MGGNIIKKRYLIIILTCSLITGIIIGFIGFYIGNLPPLTALEEYKPMQVSVVYSDDGEVIGNFFCQRRIVVPLNKIPNYLKQAIICVEDSNFYNHCGIDIKGIIRAIWKDIKKGKIVEGGSTITQQLSKVLFLTPEKTFKRKIKEMLLAFQIERRYTKDEILKLYLNQVYLGHGAYGVEAAARTYFGKSVSDLNLAECALIAGLPKSPNTYSPFKHPERAKRRRAHVLKRMVENGIISKATAEKASKEPLTLTSQRQKKQTARYFLEMVRQYVEEKYGYNYLYNRGLNIYTTLNMKWQREAEQAVKDGINAITKREKYKDNDYPEAALLTLDINDGAIKAIVGGVDFEKSQYNRAIQARRQAGSSFKPFIYAAAIDAGFTPADIIVDSPVVFKNPTTGREWIPKNYSNRFYGKTTLRQALEHSRNVVTVKLLNKIGVSKAIEYARKMGIESPLKPYLSLALGTSEVTLKEMVSAYCVFASGGTYNTPYFIKEIKERGGDILEQHIKTPHRALSAATAYILTSMLKGVVERGTGKIAKTIGRPIAAKTGTTDNCTDAWFIGFTPQIATGVWVGFDTQRTLGKFETGAQAAGPIFVKFMSQIVNDLPSTDFDIPEGITFVYVDYNTGKPVTSFDNPNNIRKENIIKEVFKIGTEPLPLRNLN